LLNKYPHELKPACKAIVAACVLTSSLGFALVEHAFAKSPFEDAACNDLRIRLESRFSRLGSRELNFFLFDAADLGCKKEVTRLLDSGAAIDARDRAGNTAFLLASRKGHTELVDILAGAKADIYSANLNGSNALLMAVNSNRRKTVKSLLALGLDPNTGNKHGHTPLIGAVYNGNQRLVTMLLEAGANPDVIDSTGKGAIIYAAGKGFHKLVNLLLKNSSLDVNKVYGNELTALMWAAGYSNDVPEKDGLETINSLLAKGADTTAIDNRGKTALHIASARGHSKAVQVLLEHGAVAGHADREGKTAADLASSAEIRLLIEKSNPQ